MFDGVDDYVEVPDAPELDMAGTDYTVEWWAYFTGLTMHSDLISKRGAGHPSGYSFGSSDLSVQASNGCCSGGGAMYFNEFDHDWWSPPPPHRRMAPPGPYLPRRPQL